MVFDYRKKIALYIEQLIKIYNEKGLVRTGIEPATSREYETFVMFVETGALPLSYRTCMEGA